MEPVNNNIGIYSIQSLGHPSRIYIGSSVNIKKRWKIHINNLRLNKHVNRKLQNHYNKYTECDLKFTILKECLKEDLIKEEQRFIDKLNPYFNICKVAGSLLGHRHSIETKDKLSKIAKKRKHSQATKDKIAISRTGNIGGNKNNIGKYHHSQEQKDKISEAAKLRFINDPERRKLYSDRLKLKPIHLYERGFTD